MTWHADPIAQFFLETCQSGPEAKGMWRQAQEVWRDYAEWAGRVNRKDHRLDFYKRMRALGFKERVGAYVEFFVPEKLHAQSQQV